MKQFAGVISGSDNPCDNRAEDFGEAAVSPNVDSPCRPNRGRRLFVTKRLIAFPAHEGNAMNRLHLTTMTLATMLLTTASVDAADFSVTPLKDGDTFTGCRVVRRRVPSC